MARRKVICTPMMEVERASPKTPFLGWGKTQKRSTRTRATSPRLLKYRSCIAGEMSGKTYSNLKDVQEKFRDAAHKCSGK